MSEWIGDVNNDSYEGEWREGVRYTKEVLDNECVIITKKEYESLLYRAEFLEMLEAHGVDNWQGYEEACEMMNEED